VQRLAEKSANATKQIEVLVRTIQSDTNEAVVSMERSTTDVVSGALLAENAGAGLDEIEKVSNQIAMLVQNISNTARQQATAAAGMARNMGVLQEISAQTAESTGATSEAIGKLAAQASELRKSVAGFKLPEGEPPPNMTEELSGDDDLPMPARTAVRAERDEMIAGASAEPEERGRAQASESLLWVSRELGITLNDAREALERYAENPANRDDLQRFAELLHAAARRAAHCRGAGRDAARRGARGRRPDAWRRAS
jgi:hypothetical protein